MSNYQPENIGEFKEIKKNKLNTPGTIAQKFSLKVTNKKVKIEYKNWFIIQLNQKHFIKLSETILKKEDIDYKA